MPSKSSEERREEISQALLRTMARHGYTKSSISKIAAEADLTPGLIHYHFKTKQDILRDLISRLVGRQSARLQGSFDETAGAAEKLRDMLNAMLATGESADEEMASAWVVITAEAIRQPEIRSDFNDALGAMAGVIHFLIESGVQEGIFNINGLSAEACTAALMAAVHGYLSLGVTVPEQIPRGTAAEATWRMACGLLGIAED